MMGGDNGRMMRQKMVKKPALSMRAALVSSAGTVT
jgi:hypothetical protein